MNIPNSLKACPNWVCWSALPAPKSHSGIKKVPVDPKTGKYAKSNDPQTWSDFDTAVRESAKYSGIGFMFSESPFFGVDIDDCREEIEDYLNGGIDNIIHEIIHCLGSYAEFSQSGNGIHIICRGSLPPGGRRKGKIEMYDNGRFFVMTGKICSDYTEVAEASESIKTLHERYIGGKANNTKEKKVSVKHIESESIYPLPCRPPNLTEEQIIAKAMRAKNGKKFSALFSGDISGYDSASEATYALLSILAFWCGGDIELMDSIFRKSGLMRDKWDRVQSGSTYGKIQLEKAVSNCNIFYNPHHSNKRNNNPDKSPVTSTKNSFHLHTLDDTGNAMRLRDIGGDVLRYCYVEKSWLYYDEGKWHYDAKGIVYVYSDIVLENMKEEQKTWAERSDECNNHELLEHFNKHMKHSRSSAAKKAMVREFEHLVAISPAEMDSHKTLVNSQNGVIDLKTCSVSPHDPNLYLTKMIGTSLPSNPKTPVLWLNFLAEIFNNNIALIRYIQKALGYSLSGITTEQCMFILYGSGRNGKSTFLEIIRNIFRDYATNIQPESIMLKSINSNASSDIARLKGARLVTSVEPNKGMLLNEALIKQFTGGDIITARKLYCNEFEFRPEFKLWIATNYKPQINGTDNGIWRRIHMIPFSVTIPREKVDKKLLDKLSAELPDILAWILEGYRLWNKEGLKPPQIVIDAVKEYRNEMDTISSFLESDYIVSGDKIQASILYDVYHNWCNDQEVAIMSKRKFGEEMSKRFTKIKSNGIHVYKGISLPEYNASK